MCDAWGSAFNGTPEAQMEALGRLVGEWGKDHWRCLAEMHAAPKWMWQALVEQAFTSNTWDRGAGKGTDCGTYPQSEAAQE